jgi:hypothetical protein
MEDGVLAIGKYRTPHDAKFGDFSPIFRLVKLW